MIFYACVKYDEHHPETYKGIEVTTIGNEQDVVASFESYDPLEDFSNFKSWSEGVGDENVAFCDSLRHFANDYKSISDNASNHMLNMVYGEHTDCY